MCGRFTLRADPARWADSFLPGFDPQTGPSLSSLVSKARYNIAPTQKLLVIRTTEDGMRSAAEMRWGLVPSWASDIGVGNRAINARSETVAEKPTFRSAYKNRRCLIPADGYYEWQSLAGEKLPYLFHCSDERVFALAGLWEANSKLGIAGAPLMSCTILTTNGNAKTAAFHERMPVILDEVHWQQWLDPYQQAESLTSLLVPAADDLLTITRVSKAVNNPKHEGPECLFASE